MAEVTALRVFRKLAMANRLANARLHRACGRLDAHDLSVPRASFFGSIQATLNHILMVDRFYIGALEGRRYDRPALDAATACPDLPTLAEWQAASDERLIGHVESLTPETLIETIGIERPGRVQRDRRDDILSHLFQHQTHHRGQVHGLLSATPVAPPQLDEFIVGDDAAARADDMATLGWDEARLMS
jgi:uncharacterized damage-inducible protein DinB